jgi:hypothetical protein
MWARDSFPLQCLNLNVQGRFSMIGFDAKVLDKKPKNIRDAAEEILNHVKADRPAVCATHMLKILMLIILGHFRAVHVRFSSFATVLGAWLSRRLV